MTVFVRLLDEGTDVMRPVEGEPVSPGLFRLVAPPGYEAEDETWEFPPGALVRCEERRVGGETLLVATQRVETE